MLGTDKIAPAPQEGFSLRRHNPKFMQVIKILMSQRLKVWYKSKTKEYILEKKDLYLYFPSLPFSPLCKNYKLSYAPLPFCSLYLLDNK